MHSYSHRVGNKACGHYGLSDVGGGLSSVRKQLVEMRKKARGICAAWCDISCVDCRLLAKSSDGKCHLHILEFALTCECSTTVCFFT